MRAHTVGGPPTPGGPRTGSSSAERNPSLVSPPGSPTRARQRRPELYPRNTHAGSASPRQRRRPAPSACARHTPVTGWCPNGPAQLLQGPAQPPSPARSRPRSRGAVRANGERHTDVRRVCLAFPSGCPTSTSGFPGSLAAPTCGPRAWGQSGR